MSDGDTRPDGHPYDAPHLARNPANYAALTPLGFLERAAAIYPDKLAVIEPAPAKAGGERRFTYRQFYDRARRFADALRRRGIGRGDTVSVLAPNVPALLEAHYAVPMAGAVLNALNYRLDARSIAFILDHGGAKLLIADREFAAADAEALREYGSDLPLVEIAGGRWRRAARRGRIRGFSRRGRSRRRLVAAGRRMERDRAELHLGHDRQPERRRLSPPRRLSERARQRDHVRARPAFGLSLDPADVPLQRLDLYLGRHGGGRHACLSAPRRAGSDLRRDRRAPGDASVRRADRAEHARARAG